MAKSRPQGDPFDVRGPIGNIKFKPRDSRQDVDYSDPQRQLQRVKYERSQNFLLHWNPFMFEQNTWTQPINVQCLQESIADFKQNLMYAYDGAAGTLGPDSFKRLSQHRRDKIHGLLNMIEENKKV